MKSKSRRNFKSILAWLLLAALSAVAIVRLFRAGYSDSMDFEVYWKAGQAWLSGASPYVYGPAERGFVFKYPPFLLPLFFPLGFLSYGPSKLLWCAVELGCLAYSFRWLLRQGVDRRVAIATTFLFWWIWLAHFYAGQFTMVLMAVALWAVAKGPGEKVGNAPESSLPAWRLSALSLVLTAKVFSVTTLGGVARELFRWRMVATGAGVLLALNGVLLAVSLSAGQGALGFLRFYEEWVRAAMSGGAELGHIVIRGQMNHGFTAGVLRWAGVEATRTSADLVVAVVLVIVLGSLWARAARSLPFRERWLGWMGVSLITHPLAWHHSFVLAYPLCAVSLDRAARSGSRKLIALSILGVCCIGIIIPNVMGLAIVTPFENLSVKSWGVVFSAVSLVLARKAESALPATPAASA